MSASGLGSQPCQANWGSCLANWTTVAMVAGLQTVRLHVLHVQQPGNPASTSMFRWGGQLLRHSCPHVCSYCTQVALMLTCDGPVLVLKCKLQVGCWCVACCAQATGRPTQTAIRLCSACRMPLSRGNFIPNKAAVGLRVLSFDCRSMVA